MRKNIFVSSVLFLTLAILFSFSAKANALTPILSLTGTGDGDSVQVNVTGDANSSVIFSYIKSGSGQQMISIGTTNASGVLTTTISSSSYGIPSGSSVHVAMGSINGPQSSVMPWPTVSATISSSNMLSLSQTGLVLQVGQSSAVTVSNMNGSSLYLSSNSNPIIANFGISGYQITVTANGYGTTTGTICLINNTANCGSIYVIVQNMSAQPLTFSQSSVSISSGQNIVIQIFGGSGFYSVLNNASQNGGVVTTSISGQIITLTTNSTTGSSSITICSTDMTSCGIINVTIGVTSSSTVVSFSQSNPTVIVGQTSNVSVYGPSSSLFYVSSNSNPSVVQANLSGTTLTLLGIANGSSTISICASSSNCGSITVTISPNSSSNGQRIMLNQDIVSLSIGQNLNITVSGGSMPYNILLTPNNIFQAVLNGNILTVNGIGNGSSSMSVCSNGQCASLSVTVGSANSVSALPIGCSSTVGFSQTTGSSCGSISTPVVTIPPDCTGTAFSMSTGQACPLSTIITTPVVPPTPAVVAPVVTPPAVTSTPTTNTVFKFTKSLKTGSTGTEVTQLQKKLKTLGFYTGKIDGKFGAILEKAVIAFQKAHKLAQVGSVGPQTRALLNK